MGLCFGKFEPEAQFQKAYAEELGKRLGGRPIHQGPLYAPPPGAGPVLAPPVATSAEGPPRAAQGLVPHVPASPWAGPTLPYGTVSIPVAEYTPTYTAGDPDNDWRPRRRKAVLIGINYFMTPALRLQGCINDARCLQYLLITRFGFDPAAIIVLTDDQQHPDFYPSAANIRRACRWLLADNQDGDSLFFGYSGHGSQEVDPTGRERDGMNSTILPADYKQAGRILDDELNVLLVQPLRQGARLHALIDACHSGTAIDLPFIARIQPDGWAYWEDERVMPRRPARLGGAYVAGGVPRIPTTFSYRGTQGGEAIMFSGSADDQTSADTKALSGYASTGAMTFSFIQSIEQGQGLTYNMLFRACRMALKFGPHHFTQVPQLTSSRRFDMNRRFIL